MPPTSGAAMRFILSAPSPWLKAASGFGWEQYIGFDETILGLRSFGLAAPMKVVAQRFGLESGHVIGVAREQITRYIVSKRGYCCIYNHLGAQND